MKNISFLLLSIFFAHPIVAQNEEGKLDDTGRIAIVPYVANQVEEVPLGAVNNLQSKMAQVLTQNGIAGSANFGSRFILTPNISVLSKDVVPAAPAKVALVLEVAFYIGDGYSGVKFGSAVMNVKGVGQNENKAYINAFRNINANNPELQKLVKDAKKSILSYYNDSCDFILKEAETLVAQEEYDKALYSLMSIPKETKDCYYKAQDLIKEIYTKKVNSDCEALLNMAKIAWTSGQNYEAANKAGVYLSMLSPKAKCYNEAKKLIKTMEKGVKENNDKEWKFIENQQKYNAEVDKNKLMAAKEVAIAYANHQPQMVYKITSWW